MILKNRKKQFIMILLIFICAFLINTISVDAVANVRPIVHFTDFKSSISLFCGNRNWGFSSKADYLLTYPRQIEGDEYNINGVSISPTPAIPNTYRYIEFTESRKILYKIIIYSFKN